MNIAFDSYHYLLCHHGTLDMICSTCQILTLLCINKYHRELPWLPEDVCKLIFEKLLNPLYQREKTPPLKCLAAEAA
jgi:hypothetical protein